jgi:hypothetical protein
LTVPIIVFAKAPRPGEVKTRLAPVLGAEGAARLHERLVARTLATAGKSAVGPVELCCAPDASDLRLAALARDHGAALTDQGPGDLGRRMRGAFERALSGAHAALLIGSDCPALAPEHLREAARALAEGDDAALGPAEDGGYVLVGLRRADPSLFEGIRWGGPEVLHDTRVRLAALRWRWRELAPLWDVDRPEDLERLRSEYPTLIGAA